MLRMISGTVEVHSKDPALAPRTVRDILKATARHLPGVAEKRQGAGVIHAGAAVDEALRLKRKGGR